MINYDDLFALWYLWDMSAVADQYFSFLVGGVVGDIGGVVGDLASGAGSAVVEVGSAVAGVVGSVL